MSADLDRVLVTGGAGFIGSAIVDRLVTFGAREIVVVDNLVRGRREHLADASARGPVRFVEGDVRDRALVDSLMEGTEVVFHQAAIRITQCAEEPRLALETMVDATFEVFESAANAGVRRVVYASSASVYGMASRFPTPETHHPYANRTLYGAAKLFNEGLAAAFADTLGLDAVGLRYFNVYGPRMDVFGVYTEVLVRWMERIDAGVAPLVLGDGSQSMDFVFVDDVARANVLAAVAPRAHGVYNVGSGTETTLLQLSAVLAHTMGRPDLVPEFGPERAVNGVRRRLADVSRAAHVLGFRSEVDLSVGLARLVDWWRSTRASAAPLTGVGR